MQSPPEARSQSRAKRLVIGALALLAIALFTGLGTWQVQRLFWKHDLIARIEARIHAEPVPPPPRAAWPAINARDDEYRRVRLSGVFDHSKEVLATAATELGGGFWVLTPLSLSDGTTVLVNRGFVPTGRRDPATRAEGEIAGPVTITGLIRISEPGGAFLRDNDPAANRWYSRDVAAITQARGLTDAAPYFVDADAAPNPGGYPVGGLTRVNLPDNHLVYAITWYAMALGLAAALIQIARRRW